MNQLTQAHQIQQAIMFGTFSNEELNSIADAIRHARATKVKQVKRQLRVGDTVSFNSARTGVTSGTLEKVAVKFATIRTKTGLWRVPMNLIEVQ